MKSLLYMCRLFCLPERHILQQACFLNWFPYWFVSLIVIATNSRVNNSFETFHFPLTFAAAVCVLIVFATTESAITRIHHCFSLNKLYKWLLKNYRYIKFLTNCLFMYLSNFDFCNIVNLLISCIKTSRAHYWHWTTKVTKCCLITCNSNYNRKLGSIPVSFNKS